MRVYRIEHIATKQGPYTFFGHWSQWSTRDHNGEATPGPIRDGLGYPYQDCWFFGFPSMEWLNAWFTGEELATLSDQGFVLGVYEAEEIKLGKKQLIFNCEKAQQIERINL